MLKRITWEQDEPRHYLWDLLEWERRDLAMLADHKTKKIYIYKHNKKVTRHALSHSDRCKITRHIHLLFRPYSAKKRHIALEKAYKLMQ